MVHIEVEQVWNLINERARINAIPLSEIIWMLDAKELKIDITIINDFELTGLNNVDFIATNYWKKGVDKQILEDAGLEK